jgi:hypothetical protein
MVRIETRVCFTVRKDPDAPGVDLALNVNTPGIKDGEQLTSETALTAHITLLDELRGGNLVGVVEANGVKILDGQEGYSEPDSTRKMGGV